MSSVPGPSKAWQEKIAPDASNALFGQPFGYGVWVRHSNGRLNRALDSARDMRVFAAGPL
jgi:hypothetical protein